MNNLKMPLRCLIGGLITLILSCGQLPVSALTATSLSPASGPIGGGSRVTIKGTGFTKTATETFSDVAAGVEHAVMLSQNGHVWSLGRNTYGQLGASRIEGLNSWSPTPLDITDYFKLANDDQIILITSGDYSSFAMSQKHRIFAWGYNNQGQLGNGDRNNQATPVEITANFTLEDGDYVTNISSGVATSFALTKDGHTFVWGDRSDYQDGQQNEVFAPSPTPVLATNWMTENVRQLVLGYRSGIFVDANERVRTWGRNQDGEMGRILPGNKNEVGSRKTLYYITDNFILDEDDYITDVEAGNGVMSALTRQGQVFIWGGNSLGMLGIGDELPNPDDPETGAKLSSVPINLTNQFAIAADDRIVEVSVGNSHVLALSQYGRVFSWGAGDYGQLGTGNMMGQPAITEITDMFNLPENCQITKVLAAAGGDAKLSSYSYALDDSGVVYGWGGDKFGKPGINVVTNTSEPGSISGRLTVNIPNVAEVSFGDQPAEYVNVVNDGTLLAIVPASEVVTQVDVNLTDRDGNVIKLDQPYSYLNPDEPTDDNKPGDDKNNDPGDNNKNGNDTGDGSNQPKQLPYAGSSDTKLKQSQAISPRISAPNTGYRLGLGQQSSLW